MALYTNVWVVVGCRHCMLSPTNSKSAFSTSQKDPDVHHLLCWKPEIFVMLNLNLMLYEVDIFVTTWVGNFWYKIILIFPDFHMLHGEHKVSDMQSVNHLSKLLDVNPWWKKKWMFIFRYEVTNVHLSLFNSWVCMSDFMINPPKMFQKYKNKTSWSRIIAKYIL